MELLFPYLPVMKQKARVPQQKYLFYIAEDDAGEEGAGGSSQWQGKQREMKNQIQTFAENINRNNTDLQKDITSVRDKFEEHLQKIMVENELKVHIENEFSNYKDGINDKIAKLDDKLAEKLGAAGSGNSEETLELKKAQQKNLEDKLANLKLKNELL